MLPLKRQDLFTLEKYAEIRKEFRAKVMAHKKNRRIAIGPHVTLYFEDRLTMHYQIQEILRVEKIFEADGIEEELQAYNPLIPNGNNWKATMMIEYEDVVERAKALVRMRGIEDTIWVKIGDLDKVYSIADEDLERENDEKTSAVHFLRFELDTNMVNAAKQGATIEVGTQHDAYHHQTGPLAAAVQDSLLSDLA